MHGPWHYSASIVILTTFAARAPAQPKPGAADLPVSQIVLFSSGVGYFQRDGQVDGNARIDLQFPQNNINDLLKSLVLQDLGGGVISTISYDNRDPLQKTLKSFAIDLTGNPSMGDLLNQARGERVEIVTQAGRDGKTPPETVAGTIVGVEVQQQPVEKGIVEIKQLNVLTTEGLQGIALSQIKKVRFLKAQLDQEFRKALEILATGHDTQKKSVSLNFSGEGKRKVRVGYVTESPLWKTSYRLSLNKDKLFLQGWAIVENTTDDDWNNVRLGLVSGRPISFQMDLYEPLYVTRPVVEPELFASLRPPTYSGDLLERERKEKAGANADGNDFVPKQFSAGLAPASPRAAGASGGRPSEEAAKAYRKLDEAKDKLRFDQGVASAATATELGEYFQYVIEKPVSLPRQKSALLPIVNKPVEGTKVSIYNQNVHAKFPLLGLRFKNTTKLHLTQGPITVFEEDSYAGDARINDIQPNETRLLSYAIDLGTEVSPEFRNPVNNLLAVKVFKGILHATSKIRQSKAYVVKNRSEHDRLVLLEHPYRPDFQLVSPPKADERTRDLYRFEVKAEPNKAVTREIVEEQTRVDQLVLTNLPDDAVRFYLRSNASSSKVKKALEEALVLKNKLAETQNAIGIEERALHGIEQDQARMRANMERVPPTSEAYKRYLKKFDDQETEIEHRRAQIARLQETAEQQRKTYETFLLNLNVE